MFIFITEKIEKHSRTFAVTLAVVTGASLIGFFTVTGGGSTRENKDLPTIKGKPVDIGAYQQAVGLVKAQYIVLQGRELRNSAANQDRIKQEAVIQMLLDRKAKELGLRITDDELLGQIRSLPLLQNQSGQFDPEIYHKLTTYLNAHGVDEATFEDVMRTQLLHAKLQSLVASAAKVTPNAVAEEYQPLHEKMSIDLVTFNMADYPSPIIVSNEAVQEFYEKSKEAFREPAKAKVRYATFPYAAEEKTIKLTDEDITDFYDRYKTRYQGTNNVPPLLESVKAAVQADLLKLKAERAANDRATEFTVKLVGQNDKVKPDFDKTAAAMGVTVKTTDYFSGIGSIPGIDAGPDFAQKAFSLNTDQPFSDPVPGSNEVYVLNYVDIRPSTIPPFEDVKAKATDQVKRLLTLDATIKAGHGTVELLKKLIAAGKTFDQAASSLKLKVTTPPSFTVADDKLDLPAATSIQQAALGMATGATSEFLRTATGGLVFHLRTRQPADPVEFEKNKEQFAQQLLQRDRQGLFNDWIQSVIRDQKVDFKFHTRTAASEDADQTPAGS